MHPDLSPHLHMPECNKLIESLKACHANNKFGKFIGYCNDIDREVWKCLKKERQQNAANNRQKAKERQQQLREKIKATEEL